MGSVNQYVDMIILGAYSKDALERGAKTKMLYRIPYQNSKSIEVDMEGLVYNLRLAQL